MARSFATTPRCGGRVVSKFYGAEFCYLCGGTFLRTSCALLCRFGFLRSIHMFRNQKRSRPRVSESRVIHIHGLKTMDARRWRVTPKGSPVPRSRIDIKIVVAIAVIVSAPLSSSSTASSQPKHHQRHQRHHHHHHRPRHHHPHHRQSATAHRGVRCFCVCVHFFIFLIFLFFILCVMTSSFFHFFHVLIFFIFSCLDFPHLFLFLCVLLVFIFPTHSPDPTLDPTPQHRTTQHRTTQQPNHATPNPSPHPKVVGGDRQRGGELPPKGERRVLQAMDPTLHYKMMVTSR